MLGCGKAHSSFPVRKLNPATINDGFDRSQRQYFASMISDNNLFTQRNVEPFLMASRLTHQLLKK